MNTGFPESHPLSLFSFMLVPQAMPVCPIHVYRLKPMPTSPCMHAGPVEVNMDGADARGGDGAGPSSSPPANDSLNTFARNSRSERGNRMEEVVAALKKPRVARHMRQARRLMAPCKMRSRGGVWHQFEWFSD